MTSRIIRIGATDGGTFGAYLSTPPRGDGPGVVVIQEIFGVNGGLRGTADELASRGYVALAPDLFWRLEPDDELRGRSREEGMRLVRSLDIPHAIADLSVCVASLREMGCAKVGTLGYCMGGRLAFTMAMSSDAECDVSFHAVGIEHLVDGARGLQHPVQVHMGEDDAAVPPDAQQKIRDSLGGHPLAEVYTYPGAQHGFARPEGKNFKADAYELGMERMYAFFGKHLS